MRWLLVAALLSSPVRAAADGCAVAGVATAGTLVTVRQARGLRRVRLPGGMRVRVTPLRQGIAAIESEDHAWSGTTRDAIAFAIARPTIVRQNVLELAAGVRVEGVRPSPSGNWLEVDVPLEGGVWARRVRVACEALTLVDVGTNFAPESVAGRVAQGPRWRARTRRLHVFARPEEDDALRLEIAPEAEARFVETARQPGWIRIVLDPASRVRLVGWVRDHELVR